ETAVTQPVDWSLVEPAVTQPVRQDAADPKGLYGLKAEPSAVSLKVGEKQKLTVTWDGDVYRTDIMRYQTDNREIVAVNEDGMIEALSEGTATVSVIATLDSKKITLGPSDYGTRTVKVSVTVTDPSLTESQRAALEKLATIEQYCKYLRERAVIRGEIAPDAPRLTLDEVNQIIDASDSFTEVYEKIKAAQKYPDYYDDIEQTAIEYWFDNRGTEWITVLPGMERIYYVREDENGRPLESQLLYPEREAPIQSTETAVDRIFTDFNETYGGTYTPEPQEQLYGLAMDIPADLHVGEVRQILGFWDADCYLPEPVIQSNNNSIALIYNDGHLFAQKAGTTTVWIRGKLDPEKVALSEGDDGVRMITKTITVTDSSDLTNEQKTALATVHAREGETTNQFLRIKAEIKGLLKSDAPRLSLDEVSQIIEASDSIEEILRKLTDAHPYPDYYGGSGFTSVYYCLNKTGTERIRIDLAAGHPAHGIGYDRLDQNGIQQEWRELYPDDQVIVYTKNTKADWLYRTLHEIAGNIPRPGDANCDGSIDVADAVLIARFAAEDREAAMTDQGRQNADVTHDGNTDGQDAAKLLQFIAKKLGSEDLTEKNYAFSAVYVRTPIKNTGSDPQVKTFSTREELDAFIAENAEAMQISDIDEEPGISLADAAAKYTSDWFDAHKLLIVSLTDPSGSIRHAVTGVSEDIVRIDLFNTHGGFFDMADWHILIELDKSAKLSDDMHVLTNAVD
ncbi:MAG: Ig-like domain-containing protein, partial [Oscillospiraceae bacterium]|nr:Ig-like domain-containing protein [Oscillospiraceae bacterium]